MLYTVHYPNGVTKKHQLRYNDICVASLDKVFYNGDDFFQITEMSEEEIWVEVIIKEDFYNKTLYKSINKNFVFFEQKGVNLIDY